MFPPGWGGLLRRLVDRRVAFVVSGGTGVGKTTLLGALLGESAADERVVVVEDVRELPVSTARRSSASRRVLRMSRAPARSPSPRWSDRRSGCTPSPDRPRRGPRRRGPRAARCTQHRTRGRLRDAARQRRHRRRGAVRGSRRAGGDDAGRGPRAAGQRGRCRRRGRARGPPVGGRRRVQAARRHDRRPGARAGRPARGSRRTDVGSAGGREGRRMAGPPSRSSACHRRRAGWRCRPCVRQVERRGRRYRGARGLSLGLGGDAVGSRGAPGRFGRRSQSVPSRQGATPPWSLARRRRRGRTG